MKRCLLTPYLKSLSKLNNTTEMLKERYDNLSLIPIPIVRRDYFSHLTVDSLLRKIASGDIALPLVRIDDSQKTVKSVHIVDLAAYIDDRRADAVKECRQLQGGKGKS